jgi:SAM-dependent methyltransferase
MVWSSREAAGPLAERTSGVVPLSELNIDSPNRALGSGYLPTPVWHFKRIMKQLPIDPRQYAFMDYGCGKGRTLVLAAEAGFREVDGVDFSPELCQIARGNAVSLRGSTPIYITCRDASSTDPPSGNCVLYFSNPFQEDVVKTVLGRIEQSIESATGEIFIVYYTPAWRRVFDASPHLSLYRQCMWTPCWYVIYRAVHLPSHLSKGSRRA